MYSKCLPFCCVSVVSSLVIAGGELTPTLKLKRGPTSDKYSEIIEAFYA